MQGYDINKLFNYNNYFEKFLEEQRVANILTEFDFNHQAKVYLGSGQMFNQFGRMGLELIADICEAVNLNYYLPQHNASINDKSSGHLITNKMILDGDNAELKECNMMFSHFTIPEDSGLSAECAWFAHMKETNPEKYYANVAILDDIRLLSEPNPLQKGVENQVIYMNSYTAGIPDYFGETLYDCFKYMHDAYINDSCKKCN